MQNCLVHRHCWRSLVSHRHYCAVVGPEIGSPHEGSVPWSSPWGAAIGPALSSVPCTDQCCTCLPLALTKPCHQFFSFSVPLVCSFKNPSPYSPAPTPPSLKIFPPSRSWTPSPTHSVTLPTWLQNSSAFTKRCLQFLLMCVLRCGRQCEQQSVWSRENITTQILNRQKQKLNFEAHVKVCFPGTITGVTAFPAK